MMLLLTYLAFLASILSCLSTTDATSDFCLLSKDSGPCRAQQVKFSFNKESGKCEAFIFGGCKGNLNKFDSLQECHSACLNPLEDESIHIKTAHCQEPPLKSARACMGFFPRFTFNPKTLKCEKYIYGGCGASANMFLSVEECMTTCYFGDPLGAAKVRSSPSGARTRGRNEAVLLGPLPIGTGEENEDICSLPPVTPHLRACLAFMPKWTYDTRQGKCIPYTYGGCYGTKNVFNSEAECSSVCPSLKPAKMWVQPPQCSEPPVQGLVQCMGFSAKFTFDGTKCVPYTYGGCGATGNVFDTMEQCFQTCDKNSVEDSPKVVQDVCGLEIETGPCRGYMPMFAFNKETKRCEKFIYGGCKGNLNRFSRVEDCVNTCGGQEPQDESSLCSAVACENLDFMKAKGCIPQINPGECCPSSWDCSTWTNSRLQRRDECFWSNDLHPNGKFYAIGEAVPEANQGCRTSCACVGMGTEAKIICAIMDCAHNPILPGENCTYLYDSPDACCPKKVCNQELEAVPQCQNSVLSGQKIYDPSHPCKECFCTAPGTLECRSADCALNMEDRLIQGCLPVYTEGRCCPSDWICPSEAEERPQPRLSVPSLGISVACPPGINARRDYVDYLTVPPLEEALDQIAILTNWPSSTKEQASLNKEETSNSGLDPCLASRPPEGPCEPYIDRWTFDLSAKMCKPYKTSFTKSTAFEVVNSFDSQETCEKACKAHIPLERDCRAKAHLNLGGTRGDRCLPENKYRFNEETGECQDYSSLGCALNKDSYHSLEECEAHCKKPAEDSTSSDAAVKFPGKSSHCNLPTEMGNCKSILLRFFYDAESGICRPFTYSGCQGNLNNFVSENSCIQTCVPQLADNQKPAAAELVYLGDPCQMEKDQGKCRGKQPMFFYDSHLKVCKLFYFGGCGGNANKFATVEECQQTCPTVDSQSQALLDSGSVCDQSLAWFKCPRLRTSNSAIANSHEVWAYDQASGQCQNFGFLCENRATSGNVNRFESRDVCNAYCVTKSATVAVRALPQGDAEESSVEDPCLSSVEIGRCRAAIRRYYFDLTSGVCKGFFYGGCGGNLNNFASKSTCQARCRRHLKNQQQTQQPETSVITSVEEPIDICQLAVETGPCKASKPRFFFNSHTRKCERFIYGGCRGNANNFERFEECVKKCSNGQQQGARADLERKGIRPAQCAFQNQIFNLGDYLRLANDSCTSCTCSSPPSLTCVREKCAEVKIFGTTEGCSVLSPPGSCCQRSIICRQPVDSCTTTTCPPRPEAQNIKGFDCQPFHDSCGCHRGFFCIGK